MARSVANAIRPSDASYSAQKSPRNPRGDRVGLPLPMVLRNDRTILKVGVSEGLNCDLVVEFLAFDVTRCCLRHGIHFDLRYTR